MDIEKNSVVIILGDVVTFTLCENLKWPGRGVDHPPHLKPRLKKEKSYTSTPPLGLRGLF